MRRITKKLLHYLPLLLIVLVGVPVVGMAANEAALMFGLRTVPVPVVGTGSMYPSLYWSTAEGGPEDESKKVIEEYRNTPHLYHRFAGIHLLGHTYLYRPVSDGDIVAFKNETTATILKNDGKDTSSGFIKRVIGVPGDTIELRDGFVYRNDALIDEPYIAAPRSSYGGTSLKDCEKLTVPPGKYFVLGDNRKISDDSRFELGLVDDHDIQYVLPTSEQKIYRSLWRNTDKDASLIGQPTLSPQEFVELVNQVRGDKKLKGLSLKPALSKSATLRGEHLLENKDTSYNMQQAINAAGYSNIVLGEFISHGHFTAAELVENLLYSASSSKQILSNDFTDLGIAAVDRKINGCPTQIIVGHLGGYIPASYDKATVESWHGLRDNLRTIIPSWEKAEGYENVDQGKLRSLLTILRRRLVLAEEIAGVMDSKAWLSDNQTQRIKNDEADAKAAESLANELNNK